MNATSIEVEAPTTRRVRTPLGEVAVPETQVLHFAQGLLGFPRFTQWVLLAGEASDQVWLQSVEEPGLALLLVDPFVNFDGFAIDVPAPAVSALDATQSDEVLVFAPVTLGANGKPSTANLRGPILINWNTHRGLQLIVDGGPWSVREEIRG